MGNEIVISLQLSRESLFFFL